MPTVEEVFDEPPESKPDSEGYSDVSEEEDTDDPDKLEQGD